MELKFILEAILFSAQHPLTPKELRELLVNAAEQNGEAKAFKKTPLDDIEAALQQLEQEHAAASRSYRLTSVAGAWQFVSEPEYAPWIRALVGHRNRPGRLSQPALETLAIIAYRQPLTRAEIEQIRGVNVDGVIQTLLERGLVEQVGRADAPGRPATYGTTTVFLEYFGLSSLEDLPQADELRKVVVQKPESLLTVDPGLATAPPEQLKEVVAAEEAEAGSSNAPVQEAPTGLSALQQGEDEAADGAPDSHSSSLQR
jgi:segregation and condensation protein B